MGPNSVASNDTALRHVTCKDMHVAWSGPSLNAPGVKGPQVKILSSRRSERGGITFGWCRLLCV
jgi:hypothetical protein